MPTVLAIVAHTRSRRTRITGYLLLAVAGTFLILAHDLFVHQLWTWVTMSGFLALGGVFGAFGQWRRIWPPEYMGLPLIWSSLLVFTVLNLSDWGAYTGALLYLAVANTSILVGIALLVFSRWLDVHTVYKAARKAADEGRR